MSSRHNEGRESWRLRTLLTLAVIVALGLLVPNGSVWGLPHQLPQRQTVRTLTPSSTTVAATVASPHPSDTPDAAYPLPSPTRSAATLKTPTARPTPTPRPTATRLRPTSAGTAPPTVTVSATIRPRVTHTPMLSPTLTATPSIPPTVGAAPTIAQPPPRPTRPEEVTLSLYWLALPIGMLLFALLVVVLGRRRQRRAEP